MFEITKSNFLNHILDVGLDTLYGNKSLNDYKKYVETEFDKWAWNRLNRLDLEINNPNHIPNSFSPEKYALNVYNRYVKSYGMSDTDYGEFIRAFHKLAYRYFNDGDDPLCGPYSALQIFLKEPPYPTSRKFEAGFDHFKFTDSDFFNKNYDVMDEYEGKFINLIDRICRGISIFEFGNKDAYIWCNDFICIIDQLADSIKGLDRCQRSCDEYYKNILQYKYERIYDWLELSTINTKWFLDYDDDFTNYNETIYLTVKSNDSFTIHLELGKNKMKLFLTKPFEFHLDHLDYTSVQNFIELSKINDHIQNKDMRIDFDISLNKFFNQLSFEGHHKNDFVKIVKDDERLYEGRVIDLLDDTILNMNIKEFKDDCIEVK